MEDTNTLFYLKPEVATELSMASKGHLSETFTLTDKILMILWEGIKLHKPRSFFKMKVWPPRVTLIKFQLYSSNTCYLLISNYTKPEVALK